MTTILCVLRSGGIYDASWVAKLKRGVERNLTVPHRFVCLSDTDVDCERIRLRHDWPGWWAKIAMFEPGVIRDPTLYLDLDTIITGNMDSFTDLPHEFAMLENFNDNEFVGSGVMWFKEKAPEIVYETFAKSPQRIMDYYAAHKHGSYMGDQAFIWDTLERKVDTIKSTALRSYKRHCRNGLPQGTAIVCFHGRPRPIEINPKWLEETWI
jgi:hypothetical protein